MTPAVGGGLAAWMAPARLAYLFYGLAATGAVIGQVWVALMHVPWPDDWPAVVRVAAVLPFAFCLELFGMATAYLADERMRAGEHAYGFRILSALTALVAVGVIVVGHWPAPYEVVGFGGLSVAAYTLWLLHAGARRRDALRAAGLLAGVAPAYGWYRRLRHPVITARAAELARERGLGLYESLRAAELALRAERRRPAIAAAVENAIRADHADPRMAEIAARTLDLDRIAAELESRADYAGWADRLAPAVLAYRSPDLSADMSAHRPDVASGTEAAGSPDRTLVKAHRTGRARPDNRRETAGKRIARLAAQHPDMSTAELARLAGVSERHVRRVLAASAQVHRGPADRTSDTSSGDGASNRQRPQPADNGHRAAAGIPINRASKDASSTPVSTDANSDPKQPSLEAQTSNPLTSIDVHT